MQKAPREDVTVDNEERVRTMEILHRLETGEGVVSDDEDVEDRSPEELLAMLTIEERRRFEELLAHPERAAKMYWHGAGVAEPWFVADASWRPHASFFRALAKAFPKPLRSADLRFNLLGVMCVVADRLVYAYVLRHLELASLSERLELTRAAAAPTKPAVLTPLTDEPPPLEEDTGPTVSVVQMPIPTREAPDNFDDTLCAAHALLAELAPFAFSESSRVLFQDATDASLYVLQRLSAHAGERVRLC